ncbi:MAG: hypothetical protein AB7O28_04440 [Vicinamibacterales bacterium]
MARVRLVVAFGLWAAVAPSASVCGATIGDLARAAQAALPSVAALNPGAGAELRAAIATLQASTVVDVELSDFVRQFTDAGPGPAARAHRRQSRFVAELGLAVDTIKRAANSVLAPAGQLPAPLQQAIVEVQTAEGTQGVLSDLELLRKFERKYGPGSAKLNGLEVLAAYVLQRSPWFGVNAQGGPGPLEPVLAYAPSYMSRSEGKARMVGVAEIGLRRYIFAQGWGSGKGRFAWLKPAYTSFGLAWTAGTDDAMRPPWGGDSRLGMFLGWGALKVAYVAGHDQRLLVTQQFQLVPWVF